MPTKKSTSTKSSTKRTSAAKAPASRAAVKKSAVKKSAAKKSAANKSGAKRSAGASSVRQPVAAKKAPVRRAAAAAATARRETVETVTQAGSQSARQVAANGYDQAIARAQEQVDNASKKLVKRYDGAYSYGQDNVEAYVQSTTAFARGAESLGRELTNLVQSTVEANVATTKALFGATSVQELVELQAEFSRGRFSALLAESAKLTELGVTVTNEAIEPIQARLNATVERLIKPVSA